MSQPISPAGVVVVDFPGLYGNSGVEADPTIPGAARDQTNLACGRPGELRARPGLRPAEYDSEGFTPAAGTISSILPAL